MSKKKPKKIKKLKKLKKPRIPPGVTVTDGLVQFPPFRFPAPDLAKELPEEWRVRCTEAFEVWVAKYAAFAHAFEIWHREGTQKP